MNQNTLKDYKIIATWDEASIRHIIGTYIIQKILVTKGIDLICTYYLLGISHGQVGIEAGEDAGVRFKSRSEIRLQYA